MKHPLLLAYFARRTCGKQNEAQPRRFTESQEEGLVSSDDRLIETN